MEKTQDALCPRCKAVVLGAANCCWQCGEYVLVETQAAVTGNAATLNGTFNGHSPISEAVPHELITRELAQPENGAEVSNGQLPGVHFLGDTTERAVPVVEVSDAEVLSAELIEDADAGGIVLGPTMIHGQTVPNHTGTSHAGTTLPREVRVGSPFSGAVDIPPQKLPGMPGMVTRPKQDLGWYDVLIDAAPYGSLPLVFYAVLSAWGAGWSFKAGIVSAFFALCFGLPGLLGPRWKWCLGAMVVAAPILAVASWQILLGR